jgi:hypothetical protein
MEKKPEETLAYKLGVAAWAHYQKTNIDKTNPYKPDTENWKNWDKGWNQYV